ncbi:MULTISPECIES: hypothetical protein [unclassified Undibacterium]|uniref:hypothetical protein n=1 Tax=unclassified Undibacterium TaxID=2630295 RepID=UPI00164A930C|nr:MULTISPECIES: hypothetical protein [unclassified Undibacterium]MBC3877791.1 hypothetical protein [Undibacterium sp. FT79W]MBC3928730.1 hypothetical protein [Undibacterium sp. CY21W]
MKQKQLSILAASLVAAFAANVASAGQIQSSSIQIAHEVITADAQAIKAPSVTYRFAGDVDATNNDQVFQVQLVLTGGGEWKTAGNAASVVLVDNAGAPVAPAKYTVSAPAISADNKTLYATITVLKATATGSLVTPAVRFNDPAGTASTVTKLYSVVGAVNPCTNAVPNLPFAFKHFTSVSSTNIADGTTNGIADEHLRTGNTSTGTLYTFPTNIKVTVAASADGSAKIDPSNPSLNTKFAGVAGTAADVLGTPSTYDTFLSNTLVNLGTVSLSQASNGYDADATTQYLLANLTAGGAAATATLVNGAVEQKFLKVDVTASQGFQAGGTLFLSTGMVCGTSVGGAGSITFTAATAGLPASLTYAVPAATATNAVSVCYQAAGTNTIPSSTFNAVATLVKAPDAVATAYTQEQNNSCSGALYPLSGSVKIDVRNYATPSTGGNWTSVLRLINPSETNTATVYGQLIHADGSYGNWGPIATLKPRAVSNMTATAINALLTNTPTTISGTTLGTAQPTANANGAGDRLRVTAEGVSSLRVQNYLYNPDSKNFIEASSTQGVDFEGTLDRAPVNEGQYQDQDAQTGLKK